MFKWKLERPLAVFDIEATGISPGADRIVELSVVRMMPDGARSVHTFRINPGMPIPADAIRIHGITDADVADCPRFEQLTAVIQPLFDGCDLGGYNIGRFDIPMLVEEFRRAGIAFDLSDRRVVDAQRIFHRKERRDLSAALAFYCGEMHLDAHGAEADALATIRVLEAQLQRYSDLPKDVEGLNAYCNPRDPLWADRMGKLKWENGKIVLNFGKKKGTPLGLLIRDDPGFIKWMLNSDFPRDMKDIVEQGIKGSWPPPPAPAETES